MTANIDNIYGQLDNARFFMQSGQQHAELAQKKLSTVASAVSALLESLDDTIHFGEGASRSNNQIGTRPQSIIERYESGISLLTVTADGSNNPLLETAIQEGQAAVHSIEGDSRYQNEHITAVEGDYSALLTHLHNARDLATYLLRNTEAAKNDLDGSIAHAAASQENIAAYLEEQSTGSQ
jgi:hypothetical protein